MVYGKVKVHGSILMVAKLIKKDGTEIEGEWKNDRMITEREKKEPPQKESTPSSRRGFIKEFTITMFILSAFFFILININRCNQSSDSASIDDFVTVEKEKYVDDKTPEEEGQQSLAVHKTHIHRMRRGESLTSISQLYYGTRDSVRAIIRVNKFAHPDNVPVGSVIKLP